MNPKAKDVLVELNIGKDRCALIGRGGLNAWEAMREKGKGESFATGDLDLVVPDYEMAVEVASMLAERGFIREEGAFIGECGEFDLLIGDDSLPETLVKDEFCNFPSLRELWNCRERISGMLLVPHIRIIMHELKTCKENNGEYIDTISLYLMLHPESGEKILSGINAEINNDMRESMLFALYVASKGTPNEYRTEKALNEHAFTR